MGHRVNFKHWIFEFNYLKIYTVMLCSIFAWGAQEWILKGSSGETSGMMLRWEEVIPNSTAEIGLGFRLF